MGTWPKVLFLLRTWLLFSWPNYYKILSFTNNNLIKEKQCLLRMPFQVTLFWRSVRLSEHPQFTVQPSWIMLLRSDWMLVSKRTEDSKVSSHEVCRRARVQLSICQSEDAFSHKPTNHRRSFRAGRSFLGVICESDLIQTFLMESSVLS